MKAAMNKHDATDIASNQDPGGERIAFLVEEHSNPSTDYFVVPALLAQGYKIVRCGFFDLPAADSLEGALVVFVRYVPADWKNLISQVRARLQALVFFMDDDVLEFSDSSGMPLRYRYKLYRLAARHKRWLQKLDAEMWVSTAYLQQKYIQWQPKLLQPAPVAAPEALCRVFYHASASHMAEIRWLRPIMEAVLQRNERITFEIVGGEDIYFLYRRLPRVTIVHPMKWPTYQVFLSAPGRHIGLAPLLDLPFNRARSYTKFFDITRCGAVGVYSAGTANAEIVRDGEDGVVVPMEQEPWVEAILRLAGDAELRDDMVASARAKMAGLASST
jgi:hypothetical protein